MPPWERVTDLAADRHDTAPRHEGGAVLIAALLGAGLAGLMMMRAEDFALDDAYIHLAYAKSVRWGDGLSYNPGDWETGTSSPLWVLLLSLWPIPLGGASPVRAVQLLGVLLHAVTAAGGAAVTLELARQKASVERPLPLRSLTLLSGALVAATPTALQAAVSGMEVPLATAIATGITWACLRRRVALAALLGVAAIWARPETLAYVTTFATILGLASWRRRDGRSAACLAALLGATVGLAAWVGYDLAISGFPWPNPQYVKGGSGGWSGLVYLREEVLPWQPWLVSLTGVVLLGLALRQDARERRWEAAAVLLATLVTLLAIALTRPLHPGVQLYESRYFAIVTVLPATVLPLGLVATRRWIGVALVLPIAVLSGLQARTLGAALADASEDVQRVHTQVARYVASQLDPRAVVAVEGAGALRFFTPRSMTIVDLVGLNDRTAAHLHHDRVAKLCHFVRRAPTHVVIPVGWAPLFSPPFQLAPLAQFEDRSYSQVLPAREHRVIVFQVTAVHPSWRARCEPE